jgi:myo-inositol-1(or 4)-monophosphatase
MWEGDVWVAARAARAGADVVQQGFFAHLDTDMKGAVDPVTQVDRDAERVIRSVIASHFPSDSILGEEEGGPAWDSERIWIVDPLDGTVNFIHRLPQVAVSVALWSGGRPEVAVVVDVARNDEYVAVKGDGARLNGRPMRVSDTRHLGSSMVLTGFPYDQRSHGGAYLDLVGGLLESAGAVRCIGSAALDLAWVARGHADGYAEHAGAHGVKAWDMAAGALLVEEAGGRFTDQDGAEHRLEASAFVASNGAIHDELIEIVRTTMPQHLQ